MEANEAILIVDSDVTRLQATLDKQVMPEHIHQVDMPYRLTSTWQDQGCEIATWMVEDRALAWAVFQPAWWNLDYGVHASVHGSLLERDVFAWGKAQMQAYAKRASVSFFGSVELSEQTPDLAQSIEHLTALGFQKFDWHTTRFALDLDRDLPEPDLPAGLAIRPLRGKQEADAYARLHRAAFDSDMMTTTWRLRTLRHPAYRPEIDLVIVDADDSPVAFCICWLWGTVGQIEPLGVHPDYQDRGLGRTLELYALRSLRNHGAKSAFVDHVSLNEKAIALSLQTGFKQVYNALRFYVEASPKPGTGVR